MIRQPGVEDPVADLTFKARALAQAHPLSPVGHRYRQDAIAVERAEQPLPEFADWAATAFLVGYCLRRVEEAETEAIPPDDITAGECVDLAELRVYALAFGDDLREGRPAGQTLFEPGLVTRLLDRVIGTEIAKRVEHWKDNVSVADWADFERYIAWWVIHGYAVRAAELAITAAPPGS